MLTMVKILSLRKGRHTQSAYPECQIHRLKNGEPQLSAFSLGKHAVNEYISIIIESDYTRR